MIIEAKMSKQHGARQQKSSGVSLILALDVETDVSAAWFEDCYVTAHVATRNNTGTTN